MKRVVLFLFVATQVCLSQNVTITHSYYTTTFSKFLRIPVVVKWWLTKDMLTCAHPIKRTNKFTADPQLMQYTYLNKDYAKSGYDRGHNMPAEYNRCSKTGMKECFYYSNMCPQTPKLNRGAWKSLETYTRKLATQYDSILVWCGSVCKSGKTIGKDKVAVPDYCWKIVYLKKTGEKHYYSFRNDSSSAKPIAKYEVGADSLQRLSGITFEVSR